MKEYKIRRTVAKRKTPENTVKSKHAILKTFTVWASGIAWFFLIPLWQSNTCIEDNRVFIGIWKGCVTSGAEFGEVYGVSVLTHLGTTIAACVVCAFTFLMYHAIKDTYYYFKGE